MKQFLPIVFSLALIPASFFPIARVASSNTEIVSQAIEPGLINQIEQNSIRVINDNNISSLGIILSKQGNKYLVLTSGNLIEGKKTFAIKTVDGQTHSASLIDNATEIATSLRLLEFSSERDYAPAELNPAAQPSSGQEIFIVGNEQTELSIDKGQVSQSLNNSSELERFNYRNNAVSSSAVRGIVNSNGILVGFSGDETNSFITLNSFLQQLNPEVAHVYDIKLPDTAETIKPELTGRLKVLEDKARKITVKIKSSNGALGSGVIVKHNGNTYTVLTSAHVVCEQENEYSDDNCADNDYQLITSDNEFYEVDNNSIKSAEKVDLARLEFTSTKDYQVATLANYAPVSSDGSGYAANYKNYDHLRDNYAQSEQDSLSSKSNTIVAQNLSLGFNTVITPVKDDTVDEVEYGSQQNHFIFAAGYTKENRGTESEWQFNPGYALNRKTGSYNIYDRSSFDGGYELVYTAITYGGMSGGAILDVKGRVIGIHGKAEGEKINNGNTDSIILGYSLAIPIGKLATDDLLSVELDLNLNELNIEGNKPTFTEILKNEFEQTILTTEVPSHNTSSCKWIERGNQLWRLLRYEEAEQAFQQAIDRPSSNCIKSAWYGRGLSLWWSATTYSASTELEQKKKYKQAANAFKQASQNDKKFFAAIRREAIAWRKLNKFNQALDVINRAIELEPNDHLLYNDRGALLTKLGRFEKAKSAFDTAIALDSTYYLSYYNRGLIHAHGQGLIHAYGQEVVRINKEHLKKALADFEEAIKYEPKNIPAYLNRGNVYYYLNKISEAQDDYTSAIRLAEGKQQKYPQAYHNFGYIYDKQQKYKWALAQYKKAIDQDPKYCRAYVNRGRVYAIQKQWNDALKDYDEAIKVCDIDSESYLNRGLTRYKLGDKLGAIDDLQIAITKFSEQNDLENQEKARNFLLQIKQ